MAFRIPANDERSLPSESSLLSTIFAGPVPDLFRLASEPFRAVFELALAYLTPSADHRQGDGHAVIPFPGLGANEAYMRPLENCASGWAKRATTGALDEIAGPSEIRDVEYERCPRTSRR